ARAAYGTLRKHGLSLPVTISRGVGNRRSANDINQNLAELNLQPNYKGNSLSTRFLAAMMLRSEYQDTPERLEQLVEHVVTDLSSLGREGIETSQGRIWLAPLGNKGDWSYLVDIANLNRSYRMCNLCNLCISFDLVFTNDEFLPGLPQHYAIAYIAVDPRVLPDLWHNMQLGIAKAFAANALVTLMHFFPASSVDAQLQAMTTDFLQYCKAAAAKTLNRAMSALYNSDVWMSASEASRISDLGLYFLRAYVRLAGIHYNRNEPRRISWILNPIIEATPQDEDFVGKVSRPLIDRALGLREKVVWEVNCFLASRAEKLIKEKSQDFIPSKDAKQETQLPELVYPGISEYPAIEARPPQVTAFEVTKSRMLREMPPVPDPAPEEPAPPEDDIVAARWQVEAELKAKEDIMDIKGGVITYSRSSTPATMAASRPERDFV
ncbi:ASPM, partial [Symbiodinium necroappetens]